VRFATAEGRTVRFTIGWGPTRPPTRSETRSWCATTLPIPTDARIAGSDWFLPGLFAFIGGAFLLAGVVVVLVAALW